jgi:hypothetical protein
MQGGRRGWRGYGDGDVRGRVLKVIKCRLPVVSPFSNECLKITRENSPLWAALLRIYAGGVGGRLVVDFDGSGCGGVEAIGPFCGGVVFGTG